MRAVLLLLLVFTAACSSAPSTPPGGVDSYPADFAVEYQWQEGSLPPPHHYEYTIRVGEKDEIVFTPDYASNNTPVWTEPLTLTDEQLTDLFQLMEKNDVFTHDWQPLDLPPVGGSSESMTIVAGAEQFAVPGGLSGEDQRAMDEVYDAIRALVPQATWDKLHAQQEEYKASFDEDA